jgi:hypothetical protein
MLACTGSCGWQPMLAKHARNRRRRRGLAITKEGFMLHRFGTSALLAGLLTSLTALTADAPPPPQVA